MAKDLLIMRAPAETDAICFILHGLAGQGLLTGVIGRFLVPGRDCEDDIEVELIG